jgi:D-beta-D-heptose 7-phosphate kinase/D-beta-D-heptose 1-phosphate adenosyltransferase
MRSRTIHPLIKALHTWKALQATHPRRVLVAGDFMLDHYTFGQVSRISPEAPVPVLVPDREEYHGGGAANVALGLKALGALVHCLGVAGKDLPGQQLHNLLYECDTAGLVLNGHHTTVKHSFIGEAGLRSMQRMMRVDTEASPLSQETLVRLKQRAAHLMPDMHVLCLQDHNKGVLWPSLCRYLIKLANRHGVPVVVDPASIDRYGRYKGATTLAPNKAEARKAAGVYGDGMDRLEAAAAKIQKMTGANVAVTCDKAGALLLEKGKSIDMCLTTQRQVYDVSGAGDTFTCVLAAAAAHGTPVSTAVRLANQAAGLAVEKFGVVAVSDNELLLSLLRQQTDPASKLCTPKELEANLRAHRAAGHRIIFTNGCFDILHAGHVSLLASAKAMGDVLVLAVNTDRAITKLKGKGRPVNTLADRLKVLRELASVDYLVTFGDTPVELIKLLQPHVVAKGGDYKAHEIVGHEEVKAYGGRVARIPSVKGRSTTNLILKSAQNQ